MLPNSENLTKQTLIERKKKLEALIGTSMPGPSLRYSEHLEVEGTVIHAEACEQELTASYRNWAERQRTQGGERFHDEGRAEKTEARQAPSFPKRSCPSGLIPTRKGHIK